MMKRALELAKLSGKDISVGAVIVKDGKIIAEAFNEREAQDDVSAHAEILAIRRAEKVLGNRRLEESKMYVTLEPCPMCAWAIIESRIKTVYFGSYDAKYGALGSAIDLRTFANSPLKVYGGICQEECDKMLKEYFEKIR